MPLHLRHHAPRWACRCLRCTLRRTALQVARGARWRYPPCCVLRFALDNWAPCHHSGAKRGAVVRTFNACGMESGYVPCGWFHHPMIRPLPLEACTCRSPR